MDLHPSRPAADRTAEDRLSGGGSGGRHSDRVEFSAKGPRVRLTGVVIQNQGIDWSHPGNVYWQHKVCSICATLLICINFLEYMNIYIYILV